ncbi:hypothetical protein [Paraburkholderia sp. J67]|uniref:hypothetical protein n=1 Tax=Paraburkholderia sp. J67 TaxID=2805435 RepID=UPI002ABE7096|nr:hypothetical protein [Paraburkholderia sp. J67]
MDLALLHSAKAGVGGAVGVADIDRAISQIGAIRREAAGAPPTAALAMFMAESLRRRIKAGRLLDGFTIQAARRYAAWLDAICRE